MSEIYTLFGTQGSGSAAVEAALLLAGCEHRLVQASSWGEADAAQDELRRHNPLLQIPTLLLPDGSVLTESAAILMHLGLLHPGSGLLPAETMARAQALRGLVFIAANCYSAISISDYPERWTRSRDAAAIEALRQGTRDQLHRHWEIFADQFPPRPMFLSGAAPGALDLLAAVVSKWSGTRPHLQAQRPAFYATLLAIEQHPSVAAVFKRHWP
ncbi:glutathione S-transferase N-terminal domain-containing protein [Paucibacter sediminis]|uniref:Glutathione S-transferase N-terminal domain-containing protein n=1 Tax=Paucibacter sediminis TaxID=3019553 RepID=A0AA95NE87_9BURK|nr:glutathione S-transferase N-terminal domain-containing protein [Paucibacter sp. S2-9]WIT13467.1 glutathione S-transferase N-terminal domain-containing protein [Paucibacter sp. S2-9]